MPHKISLCREERPSLDSLITVRHAAVKGKTQKPGQDPGRLPGASRRGSSCSLPLPARDPQADAALQGQTGQAHGGEADLLETSPPTGGAMKNVPAPGGLQDLTAAELKVLPLPSAAPTGKQAEKAEQEAKRIG